MSDGRLFDLPEDGLGAPAPARRGRVAPHSDRVVHVDDPTCEVRVCRPGPWGNPYSHKDGTLAEFRVATVGEAIAAYREHVLRSPGLIGRLDELAGRRLGCFCKTRSRPTAPCHGDVLADLSDRVRVALLVAPGADERAVRLALDAASPGPLLVICPGGHQQARSAAGVARGRGHQVAVVDTGRVAACRPARAVAAGAVTGRQRDVLRGLYRAGVPVTFIDGTGVVERHERRPN